jgi:hypothetical protein
MPRLTLLKNHEIEQFDFPPRFTEEERSQFFVLPDSDVKFRKTETRFGYVLQEGYFIAKKKFFLPEYYPTEDVEYVRNLLDIKRKIDIREDYNQITYSFHKKIILKKNGYHSISDSKDIFEK